MKICRSVARGKYEDRNFTRNGYSFACNCNYPEIHILCYIFEDRFTFSHSQVVWVQKNIYTVPRVYLLVRVFLTSQNHQTKSSRQKYGLFFSRACPITEPYMVSKSNKFHLNKILIRNSIQPKIWFIFKLSRSFTILLWCKAKCTSKS